MSVKRTGQDEALFATPVAGAWPSRAIPVAIATRHAESSKDDWIRQGDESTAMSKSAAWLTLQAFGNCELPLRLFESANATDSRQALKRATSLQVMTMTDRLGAKG